MSERYGSLPFDEAIVYFRRKLDVPTERWADLWKDEHARAFTVAGATKAELLADLRGAIDKAIAEGSTIEDFRRDFDQVVAKHGWSYHGSRNWRTEVMLGTNMRTAYQAGRYQQMTDPDVLKMRPFWMYVHRDSVHPRPLHQSWNGTVLPADDDWWRTHYTPNGWGCKCSVQSLSHDDLEEMGKKGPDKAPNDGTYTWTDPVTGESHTIPAGIDPGWDYNPGLAAWGKPQAERAAAAATQERERLTAGNWHGEGQPERLPSLATKVATLQPGDASKAPAAIVRDVLGDQQRVFSIGEGTSAIPVAVDADVLGAQLADDELALRHVPLLPELLAKPQEVWVTFERVQETGRVVLTARALRGVKVGGEHLVLVAQVGTSGWLERWDVLPAASQATVNALRAGKLLVKP